MPKSRVKPILIVLLAAIVLFSAACGSAGSKTEAASQEPAFTAETIEEKVLYDQNSIKITATDIYDYRLL